jgi:hypothetical protein
MLLCDTHHRLIDDKEQVEAHPVELLKAFKKEHEDRIFRTQIGGFTQTTTRPNFGRSPNLSLARVLIAGVQTLY